MKTSDSLLKFAPAFLKVQQAITSVHKGANNPFFKSKYADLPSVIDAVKAALNDAGITYLQTPSPSEPCQLALTTRLLHESGEWIEDTANCPLAKADPQGYGSAITYLRRYGLQSICGLYAEDDDGNSASGNGATSRAPATAKTPAAQKSAPASKPTGPAEDWKDAVIHFGKNKGTRLADLAPNTLSWYQEQWHPKPFGTSQTISPQDEQLRSALDDSIIATASKVPVGDENPY
jgi:hypothetical protein